MPNRWFVLAVLFLVRVSMAFQFQAVPALSPLFLDQYGIDLAGLGFLIALYLSPGLIIALPGGAIGARFGDKHTVCFGLVLMVVGGAIMAGVPDWPAQVAGRLLAGTGGILLNVLMSKLVTDYFAGREIATAMGIFVNSWPVGIALALVVLPPIGVSAGLNVAMWCVTMVAVGGLLLFALGYRTPPQVSASAPVVARLRGRVLAGVLVSASIWGLYNAALGMVFGFGPAMLTQRGWTPEAASSSTSIFLWLIAISVPIGGVIADRTGRRDTVLIASCLGFAATLSLSAEVESPLVVLVAMGLVGGLAAGPIMGLPSEVLTPGNRAVGMGVFFSFYYVFTVSAPILAGFLSDAVETARAAFHFGAALLVCSVLALVLFRRLVPSDRNPQP